MVNGAINILVMYATANDSFAIVSFSVSLYDIV